MPWPTRWTGLEQFSIVCLKRLWTTSTSHDSSRSCSKDHRFTSKCWPRFCAVRLKRQYSEGWRSIQNNLLLLRFIWLNFSYLLTRLEHLSFKSDKPLYSLLHKQRLHFLYFMVRQRNSPQFNLTIYSFNQFFFDLICFYLVIQNFLENTLAYFVEARGL